MSGIVDNGQMIKRIYEVKAKCERAASSPIEAIRFGSLEIALGIWGRKVEHDTPQTGNRMLGMLIECDPRLRGSEFYIITEDAARYDGRFMDLPR